MARKSEHSYAEADVNLCSLDLYTARADGGSQAEGQDHVNTLLIHVVSPSRSPRSAYDHPLTRSVARRSLEVWSARSLTFTALQLTIHKQATRQTTPTRSYLLYLKR